jgi:PAS domain S-box-containing protein
MKKDHPDYEELKRRCEAAEAELEAIRSVRIASLEGPEGTLVVRLAEAEKRADHIKQVLLAIRNVNQLIVAESDPRRLITRACANLTETMGYFSAWIALFDPESGRTLMTVSSGYNSGFDALRERLEAGDLPPCVKRAFESSERLVVGNPLEDCPDCPVAGEYGDRAGLVARLVYDRRVYGVLVVSVPRAYAQDAEEKDLFEEVAGDLAFALRKMEDTRELQLAKETLQKSQQIARLGSWDLDILSGRLHWSDEVFRIFGLAPGEFKATYEAFLDMVHPDDRAAVDEAYSSSLRENRDTYEIEHRIVRRDTGEVRHVHERCEHQRDEAGRVIRSIGMAQDITKHKRVEQALEKSGAELAAIYEHSPVMMCVLDMERRVIYANQAFTGFTGVPEEDLIAGRACGVFGCVNAGDDPQGCGFGPDCAECALLQALEDAAKTGNSHHNVEYRAVLERDGERRSVTLLCSTALIQTPDQTNLLLTLHDISERQRTAEALRDETDKTSSILRAAPVGIGVVVERVLMEVNDRVCEISGYSRGEILGQLSRILYPDDAEFERVGRDKYAQIRETGSGSVETRWRRKDGAILDILLSSTPIDPADWSRGVTFSAMDITERKRQERALRESEEKHRALLGGLPDVVMRFDREGRHLFVSENVRQMVTLEAADFIGKTHLELGFPEEQCELWESSIRAVFDTGEPSESEFSFLGRKGLTFLNWRLMPERDANGAVRSVLSLSRDITAQREAEKNYRTLFREMLDGFALHEIICDESGQCVDYRFLAVNPAFERMTGLKAADIVGKRVLEVMPDTEPYWIQTYGRVAILGEPAHFQNYSAEIGKHFEVTAFRPAPGRFACIFADITERKKAEEALGASEQRFRSFVENANDIIYSLSPEGVFTYVSPNWTDILGHPVEFVQGKTFEVFVHPEDLATCRDYLRLVLENKTGREGVEYRVLHADGSWRWHASRGSMLQDAGGAPVQYLGIARDMTEQRERDEALRRSEQEKRLILDSTAEMFTLMDTDLRVQWANRAAGDSVGLKPEELVGRYCHEIWQKRSEPCPDCPVLEAKRTGQMIESEVLTPDGQEWLLRGYPVFDAQGHIIGLIEFGKNVTEEKRQEKALRASEAKFRALVDQAAEVLFLHDLEGNIRDVNQAAVRQTGHSREELLAMTVFDIDPDAMDRGDAVRFWQRLKETQSSVTIEGRHRRKDGSIYPVEITIACVQLENGPHMLGLARDVTERKKAEDQLRMFRTIADKASYGAAITNMDGDIIYVNDSFARMHGRETAELTGRNLSIFHNDEQMPGVRDLLDKLLGRGSFGSEEIWHARRDGSVFPTLMNGTLIRDDAGMPLYMSATAVDISERKDTIAELEKRNAFIQAIIDNLPIGLAVNEIGKGMATYMNRKFEEIYGWPREELVSVPNFFEKVYPDPEYRHRMIEMISEDIASGDPERMSWDNIVATGQDGSTKIIDAKNVALPEQNLMISLVQDMTESRRAEQAVRESEERFSKAFQLAPAPMVISEIDTGEYIDVNEEWVRMLGYSREENIGRTSKEMGIWAENSMRDNAVAKLKANGSFKGEPVRFVTKSGGVRHVLWSADIITLNGRRVMLSLIYDHTDRIQAEEALRKTTDMLDAIRVAQSSFIEHGDPRATFDALLDTLVRMTGSEFGFLDEVLQNPDGSLYKLNLTMSNIAWSPETREFYEKSLKERLEFRNLQNLAGWPALDGKPLIANDAPHHPRSGGLPAGHPAIRSFMGLPLYFGDRLVGVAGVANRPGGYDEQIAKFLNPFLSACASIIHAMRMQTKEHETADALRDALMRQEAAVVGGGVGLWDWNLETNEVYYSTEWKKQIGYEDHEIGNSFEEWEKRVHPDDLEPTIRKIQSLVNGTATRYQVEFRFRHKDGSWRWILAQATILRDGEGRPLRTLGSHVDITERKRVEEALRESEGRVRAKLEAVLSPESDIGELALADIIDVPGIQALMNDFFAITHMPVAFIDLDGKVLIGTGWQDICVKFHRVNPESLRSCIECDTVLSRGVPAGEYKMYKCKSGLVDVVTPIMVGGRHMGNLFTGQFLWEDEPMDREAFRAQAHRFGYDETAYLQALDRVPRFSRDQVERVMSFYMKLADMIALLSYSGVKLARMLTERKRAEEARETLQAQLVQAQKMESVGRLAGGVAHDFNNMLNVILGHTEMVLEDTPPGTELRADLEEIQKAAKRSADLTRQLLAFARRQTIAPKLLDLNEVIEGMLKMLRRLIGEDIDLLWKPALEVWPVLMDPTQIDQILANLVVNARDAIDGVGKITIETGTVRFDEAYCENHPGHSPGEYVLLAVSDDGCGMDKETLNSIFEPFFTTKPLGQGTGLGLATIYGIVKQNEGFVNVYSEPDKGTTFRIYIPRRVAEGAVPGQGPQAAQPATGTETVLIAEDDAALLELSRRILERLGYRVLSSNSPQKAVEWARAYPGRIHLLITDVIMPGMSGRDLWREIKAIRPELKCLFMSGYTADVIAHRGILDENVNFLQKPFSVQSFSAKIREALGS